MEPPLSPVLTVVGVLHRLSGDSGLLVFDSSSCVRTYRSFQLLNGVIGDR